MIGRRVGSWVLERELGRGGMGSVFQARHVSLPTLAAVKVLSPGLESEESFRQRFQREAELQAQLRHRNVVRVLDYLEDGGQWFLIVDYLDRGSLGDLLTRDGAKVPRPQALAWARQALEGLGHAHQKGIVHRDIKPANLLLNDDFEVVVADFGIARADAAPGLTTTGIAIGTPQYMSPEQILTPDRIDRRSDIYSLGVVLYELLTGRKPFDSGSQFSVLQAHVSEPPPPPRGIDPGISPELEAVVMRALAKKVEDRYQDCGAMIRDLDRVMNVANERTVAPPLPPPIPVGGTIRATSLVRPATPPDQVAVSPAQQSSRRRSAFQRRLLLGTAMALVVSGLLAYQLANEAPPPTPEPPPPVPVPVPEPDPVPIPKPIDLDRVEEPPVGTKPFATQPPLPRPTPEPDPHPEPALGPEASRPTPPEAPPMPELPMLPENPRVAVIAKGEPLLAGSLEQAMEGRLARRFEVADERGEPDVDELLEREGANVSHKALGAQLLQGGFHVLVLMRVEEAERRTLTVKGLSGSLMASRIRLNAYLLPTGRSLGSGWTELVEYTELSANTKARQALIGPTADLVRAIEQGWSQLQAGALAR